ncbi:MAG: CBS domain-containing protein [Planctomycetes bacterium]|nr:CBS domain-containing protein [Planctomycetota bacterium]
MIDIDKHFLYISDLIGKSVVNAGSGKGIGRVSDIIVTNKAPYPEISSVLVKPGLFGKPVLAPWDSIEPFELPLRRLKIRDAAQLSDRGPAENEIAVCDTFMDKQILDLDGAKVIRVNDLHLLKENHKIWLVHMDVGMRGFLRRLGWLKIIDTVTNWLVSMRIQPRFLSWKHVQALPTTTQPDQSGQLKLKVVHQKLNTLHPADLSEILKDLSYYERIALFRSLDIVSAAETLEQLTPDSQKPLIECIDKAKIPGIIAKMSPDKAADMLAILSQRRRTEILKALPDDLREEMTRLSSHPEQTAGAIMTTDFITQPPTATVQQALDIIKQAAGTTEAIYYIYIVNPENVLQGVVTLRRIMQAAPETALSEIMNSKVKKISENAHKDNAIKLFIKYKFGSAPVVDSHGKLKGVILFKDAMTELLPQMEIRLPR